ncbi:MAG: glycosyltransferase [Cytophaga sp.]|uniref:glycosyltransferase n=1 Tax=Cytophaga sp. TaxID=29535 RepID=UPI003F806136
MKVTLVSTVFNEAARIQDTLNDISAQTRLPDEVVITDAGSTDNTVAILRAWAGKTSFPVKILSWPKCNVAEGRNKAIHEASHEYILSTDFGCRFNPLWIESMVKPFEDNNVKVVGGTFEVIESDIETEPAKANYIICDGYYVAPHEGFIPSSRSIAYHKSVWESIGGYPEWLTLAADDLVFGMILLKQNHKIVYVNEPYVYWGRHTTLKAYGKEAYRYGLGDGEAHVNQRQFIVKSVESMLRYMFYICLILAIPFYVFFNMKISLALVLLGLTLVGFRPYWWAFKNWLRYKSPKYSFLTYLYTIPIIELSRFQYEKGYIKGYFFSSEKIRKGALLLKQVLK